ncbi:MAG: hypothetical protein AVDCRST_MAG50-2499 [uncultured Acidimicrobiales bacterium]|uniref:Uncharacterized protein n=1 Tax=uncultured Acidimicrobiales bacterium TaxID=310071 RepID=A0A6J4ID59_9ACTN|nr:MAG: hypothetical protein AVDCRST_MAG50-2499 [uncultured Acidimicrobiales bacterium]
MGIEQKCGAPCGSVSHFDGRPRSPLTPGRRRAGGHGANPNLDHSP